MTLEEIKSYLKVNKITYKELAEKSGVPESTLKNLFSGVTKNPRISTMQAIERALGLNNHAAAIYNNEITEEHLQALGFDMEAIGSLSEEDLQLIRSTLKTLVSELKNRKKK